MPRSILRHFACAIAALAAAACASHGPGESARREFDPTACYPRELNIYFGSWVAAPDDVALTQISALQRALDGCNIESVRITGMAGAPGDEEANNLVSQQRADAIAAALEAGGWSPDMFEVNAIGEEGATVDGLEAPMRRRVQISVAASAP